MNKFSLALLFIAAVIVTACSGNKKASPAAEVIDNNDNVPDSTIYGKCGEGTAMHTLELITDKGDSIVYSMEDAGTNTDVQGGLFVGDRLAVIGIKDADGALFAKKIINLTSLLGKWVSIDKDFEIREGGIVISNVKEPRPYTDWKILNGHLVISADTFDIYSLGPDSLYLENSKGIYGYKRLTQEAEGNK